MLSPASAVRSSNAVLRWIALALLLLTIPACPAEDRSEPATATPVRDPRPSILLLIADDLAHSFAPPHAQGTLATPNLTRLADEGMRFDSAFTTTALCHPSRFALFSGRYPNAAGLREFEGLPDDVPMLHETLRSQGYRTGLLGKFARRSKAARHFDHFRGPEHFAGGHDVAAIAAETRKFLDGAAASPFFLVVTLADPHEPYPDAGSVQPDRVPLPGYLPDLLPIRNELTRYAAAVERLDRGIGLVLDALRDSGRESQTLVLFTSDNGPAFPFAKSTLYDGGVHMPLIVRWPGVVSAASTSDALISFVDIHPTLLEAAGAKARGVDGRSFLSLLKNGDDPEFRSEVFLTHGANRVGVYPMRGVRSRAYKYIRNYTPDAQFQAALEVQRMWAAMVEAAAEQPEIAARLAAYRHRPAEEFYALDTDPFERVNRIDDPELAAEVLRHRTLLEDWLRRVNDPLDTPRSESPARPEP